MLHLWPSPGFATPPACPYRDTSVLDTKEVPQAQPKNKVNPAHLAVVKVRDALRLLLFFNHLCGRLGRKRTWFTFAARPRQTPGQSPLRAPTLGSTSETPTCLTHFREVCRETDCKSSL